MDRKWMAARKRLLFCLLFLAVWMSWPLQAKAVQNGDLDEYDFTEVEHLLDDATENETISFKDLVADMMDGELKEIPGKIIKSLGDSLFKEIRSNKKSIVQVLILAALSAVFSNLSSVFKSNSISDTGFYITYLLLVTLLASTFTIASNLAKSLVQTLLSFMTALLPAFFLAVAFSGGSIASVGFYEATLFVMTSMEWLFLNILFPVIQIYVILTLVNEVTGEDYLSKCSDLLKSGAEWALRTTMVLVLGMNVIQGMILPFVDSVKSSTIRKAVSAIPGLGKGADAVAEVVFGSGVLIKNGIGAAALICLVVLSLLPLLKLVVLTVMYQATGALIQPIADKRMLNCVTGVANGVGLLLRMVYTALFLFVITIAIICSCTNTRYFAG